MASASRFVHTETAVAGPVPWLFGFYLSSRIAVTLVAFQSHPVAGTATTLAGSFLFVFLAWAFSDGRGMQSRYPVPLRWIGLYLAMMGTSLLWSATDSVVVGLAYWAGLAADCLTVYLVVSSRTGETSCERLLTGFLVGAACVGVIAWCLPTLWDLRIGDEEFLHPNALGYVLALATILGLYLARRSRMAAVLTAFCGITLLRTISKACIAGCLAAAAFYLLRASHLSKRVKVAIYTLTAASIVAGWSLVEAYIDIYERSSHIETLTGRTYIWGIAWEEAVKAPWLGHGFYSFRFVIPMLGDFFPWQAHNELLQQFFSYGIVGVAVFGCMYGSFSRFLFSHRRSEWVSVALSVLIFVLIRGVADTERFDVNFPLWLLTLFALVIGQSESESAPI